MICEATGRPYREDHFRHEFSRIRNAAGLPAELQFRDLRRTAAVRMAEARISVPWIAAVTGHSIDHTTKIIETYLPRTTTMSRAAIAPLEDHRRKNKISTKV